MLAFRNFSYLRLLVLAATTGILLSANPIFTPADATLTGLGNGNGSGTSTARGDGGLDFNGHATNFAGNANSTVVFKYSGTGSGQLTPGMSLFYSFTDLVISSDPDYSLQLTINGVTTTQSGSVAGDGSTTTGSLPLVYTPGDTLTSWSAQFSFVNPSLSQLQVRYNPISIIIPSASSPEPGSFILALPALAAVFFLKKRKS
jgi:hypothetical protein